MFKYEKILLILFFPVLIIVIPVGCHDDNTVSQNKKNSVVHKICNHNEAIYLLNEKEENVINIQHYEINSRCDLVKRQVYKNNSEVLLNAFYTYDSLTSNLISEYWDFLSLTGDFYSDGLFDYSISYEYYTDNNIKNITTFNATKYTKQHILSGYPPSINFVPYSKDIFTNPRVNIEPSNPHFLLMLSQVETNGSQIQDIIKNRNFNNIEFTNIHQYASNIAKNINNIIGIGDYCVGFLHIMSLAVGYKKPLLQAHSYTREGLMINEENGIVPIELQDAWSLPLSNNLLLKYKFAFPSFANITKDEFINIYTKTFNDLSKFYQVITHVVGRGYITFLYTKTAHWDDIKAAIKTHPSVMPNSHIAEVLGGVTIDINAPYDGTILNIIESYNYPGYLIEQRLPIEQRRRLLASVLTFVNPYLIYDNYIIPVTEEMLDMQLHVGTEIVWHDIVILDYAHGNGAARSLIQILMSGTYLPIAVLQYYE